MRWPGMIGPLALLVCCASSLDLPINTRQLDDSAPQRLHGRFLHITDFHPDTFFKTYSSTQADAVCHRKNGPAGYYGAETSGCDSPISLVNATMDWIHRHVAHDIDFVIWTGDSARHDNDEKIPRTQDQIIEQNELMVRKMTEVFGRTSGDDDPTNAFRIPIVPTFGNNDIMPHNIFTPGPNRWTLKYLDIWRGFIPEAQRHQFSQGGWFWAEVVPGKLAVVSLNTMYFFASNSAVDGCANKHEPGYEQFEWLRIQLQLMRDRGMSAILIGHVPPARVNSKESWEETCWQKYALWEQQYRDVIVASIFGHMNIDHFMLQDSHHIKKGTKKGLMASSGTKSQSLTQGGGLLHDGEVTVASASDYLLDLRDRWSKLPSHSSKKKSLSLKEQNGKNGKKPKDRRKSFIEKIGGKFAERYSVSFVSPSVVPNYYPTIRIYEYNITGLENIAPVSRHSIPKGINHAPMQKPIPGIGFFDDDDAYKREIDSLLKRTHKKKEKESLKKKKYKFRVPDGPSKSSPPGPAYSPQPLTLIGYTQYFANLTHINNDFVTQSSNDVSPHTIFGLRIDEEGIIEASKWKEGKHRKHQGKKPHPKPHPKKFKFEVEYDTKTDKHYKLKDLTVRSLVDLARRIGKDDRLNVLEGEEESEESEVEIEQDLEDQGKKKKKKKHKRSNNRLWLKFAERAFVSTMDPSEIALFGGVAEQKNDEEEENMEL